MVLLENNGILPLNRQSQSLALYGVGARKTVKGGTGSGEVNSREIMNIEQGLVNAGYIITTQPWLDQYDARFDEAYDAWGRKGAEDIRNGVSPLMYQMSKSFKRPEPQDITEEDYNTSDTDLAIYVLSRNSGEGWDRHNCPGDYQLSDSERRNIDFLTEHYKSTIIVLNVGGIIDTKYLKQNKGIGAILLMCQAGSISGAAVADIISGAVNPSGKLTDTWAADYADYPFSEEFSHNNGNIDDSYYKEGIYVGYRYFDTFGVEPSYCFGFGRSYTSFDISARSLNVENGVVKICVGIKNTGEVSGREVIQVYVSAPDGKLEKPYQELAAFAKTGLLSPGEEQTLDIWFEASQMVSYYEEHAFWIMEPGLYYIRVGNSSRNTNIIGAVRLEQLMVTETLENKLVLDLSMEELSKIGRKSFSYPQEAAEKATAEGSAILLAEIPPKSTVYSGRPERISYYESGADIERPVTMQDIIRGEKKVDALVGRGNDSILAGKPRNPANGTG